MLNDIALWVKDLPTGGFLIIVVILGAITPFLFFNVWRHLHRARTIEDTPTARIRSAPQGYVEIEGEGQLMEGPPIVAPLSGTRCLWYRYRIEHKEHNTSSHGRQQSSWRTLNSMTSDELFVIEDGSGRCIIDPDGAEVIADEKDVWYGDTEFPNRGPKSHGRIHFGGDEYRYTEERLMPGHTYALGWFQSIRSADGTVKHEVAALLRHWKQDQDELLARFDNNNDGQIDANEWSSVREAATQEVIRARAHKASEGARHVMSKPPHGRKPYLISGTPQYFLVRNYRRRALFSLLGSCITLAVLVTILAIRL